MSEPRPGTKSLGTIITVGFGIVLLLHAGIAVLNHLGLQRSRDDFIAYDHMKDRTAEVVETDRGIDALQRHVLMYIHTGHPGPAQRVRQVSAQVRQQLTHQIDTTPYREDREDLEQIRERLDAYLEQFEEVIIDRRQWMRLSDQGLQSLRDEGEALLSGLVEEEMRDRNFEAVALLNLARHRLLLTETAAMQYLLRPEASLVESTRQHLAAFREMLLQLRLDEASAQRTLTINLALKVPDRYEAAFLSMVQFTRGYLHLVSVVMPGESLELTYLSQSVSGRMVERVEKLAGTMARDSGRFQDLSNLVSLLTIVLGILAAVMIRRRVVPPLVDITRALGRLAGGDLSRQIPGRERRDEIGQMAAAAHVFRKHAQETATLLVESQRLEERVSRHNAELRHKTEEMEQFTYAVSHDLKSPLVTCMGLIDCVKEDLATGDLPQVEEWLGRLQRSVTRMEMNINDLLDLSRAGRVRHEPGLIDMNTMVERVVDDLRPRAARIGAEVTIAPGLPPIHADPLRITEVFENLIANALKYGCDYDSPRVEIGGLSVEDESRLYVRDNGQGIDPRYHEKIFGVFQRLNRQVDGTGVGLALVARIMEVHGGRVWVESEPGEGATFWLAFPHPQSVTPAVAA